MKIKKLLAFLMSAVMLMAQIPALAEDEANAFTVISTTPADGMTGVSPADLQADITFSDAVDTSTLIQGNVSVSGNAYGAFVSTGEKTATIYLNRINVNLGTKYTIKLKSGIKSADGRELTEYSFSFTTMKDAPSYRQITNGDFSDSKNHYGLDAEAWNNISIIDDGGNNVLKFTPGWSQASVRQRVYVKPGKTYTARARVKSDTAQEIWLAMDWIVPGNAQDYYWSPRETVPAGQWTELKYSWTIPENVDQNVRTIKQWIAAENAGETIYVDDWQFFEEGNDVEAPTIGGGGSSGFTAVSETEDNVAKLKAFGILPLAAQPAGIISRIDLAKILLNLVGLKAVPIASEPIKFVDIDKDDVDTVSAVYLTDLMKGCSDTEFEPYESVTGDQAVKTVLTVMGWAPVAAERGGYPNGYRQLAAELGLLKTEINLEGTINYEKFASIVNEALTAEMLSTKQYTRIPDEYDLVKGGTLMDTYFKYEKGIGIIEATKNSSSSRLNTNEIIIGGETYKCDADLTDYLGYKAEFYYDTESDNDKPKILYICKLAESNQIVEFSTFDSYVSYKDGTYKVTDGENDKSKQYRLNKDKKLIVNGQYKDSFMDVEESFVPTYGSVKLIDSGNGYSTVAITDIRTILVSAVDTKEKIIYDVKGKTPVDLSDCEDLEIKDIEDGTYDIGDIEKFAVLSVIKSENGKRAKIYLSTDSVTGTLNGYEDNINSYFVIVGDNYYGPNVRQSIKTVNGAFTESDFTSGMNGTFYKDYRGNVAAITSGTASGGVGYLVNAALNSSTMEGTLEIKLFDVSNKMLNLECADSLRIDGMSIKRPSQGLEMLCNGTSSVVSQLIRYKTDGSGKVNYIDTAYNKLPNCTDYRAVAPSERETADSFRVTYSSILPPNSTGSPESINFNANSRNFNGKAQLSMKPTIFIVPLNAKDSDDVRFRVTEDYWDFGENYNIVAETYQVSGNTLITDYVVAYLNDDQYNTGHLSGVKYGIVNKITQVMGNRETPVSKVELLDGTILYAENLSDLDGASAGDVISYDVDHENYIVESEVSGSKQYAKVVFDASRKTMLRDNPLGGFNDWNRIYYANVYERQGSEVRLVSPAVDLASIRDMHETDIVSLSNAKIYMYNSETNKVKASNTSAIMDYLSAGNDCTKILIISRESVANTALIIK